MDGLVLFVVGAAAFMAGFGAVILLGHWLFRNGDWMRFGPFK